MPRRTAAVRALLHAVPLALALASACEDTSTPPQAGLRLARTELAHARERWRAVGARDYDFTLRVGCECAIGGETRVRVREGVAVSFTAPDGTARDPQWYEENGTVDEILAGIAETLRSGPHFFRARYDPRLGFPARVSVDGRPEQADDEWTLSVGDVVLHPGGR